MRVVATFIELQFRKDTVKLGAEYLAGEHLSVITYEKWPWLVAEDSQIWQNSLHWADVLVCLSQVKIDTLMEGVCLRLLDTDLDHTW